MVSLNENVSWLTAIGNDYSYEDIYVRQLMNFGRAGDVLLTLSVSGESDNLLRAVEWANRHDLVTVNLGSGKHGRLSEIAKHAIAIGETHYGRVEDVHMTICHMLCYAFMENPQLVE